MTHIDQSWSVLEFTCLFAICVILVQNDDVLLFYIVSQEQTAAEHTPEVNIRNPAAIVQTTRVC